MTYADLYLQTKIQETVFELLTQQYEMAKVQEAKEIPSVKVLDAAVVPTKKTFPPRAVITVLGTLLGLAAAITWILLKTRWDSVEASDPGKVFAAEVLTTMRESLSSFSRNGASGDSNRSSRGNSRKESGNSTEEQPGDNDTAK